MNRQTRRLLHRIRRQLFETKREKRMARCPVVALANGLNTCPVKRCKKNYTILRSMRYHCRNSHNLIISTIFKKSRRLERKYRMEKQFERRRGRKEAYSTEDFHLGLVEVKKSLIPGAGRGVFATTKLQSGDMVTEYVGKLVSKEPTDKEYALKLTDSHYIKGDKHPTSPAYFGSLINRECRQPGVLNLRKNVILEQIENNRVVVKVIKFKGDELITTYSRQYLNK